MRKKLIFVVGALVVAAAAFFILYKPDQGPSAIVMKLRWESTTTGDTSRRLRVISPTRGLFTLYGGQANGVPRRLTAPQSVDVERTVALDAAQIEGLQKVCVIAADDASELQSLEDKLQLIWPRLGDEFCVPIGH